MRYLWNKNFCITFVSFRSFRPYFRDNNDTANALLFARSYTMKLSLLVHSNNPSNSLLMKTCHVFARFTRVKWSFKHPAKPFPVTNDPDLSYHWQFIDYIYVYDYRECVVTTLIRINTLTSRVKHLSGQQLPCILQADILNFW